ncbi:hypothetical protein V518_0445 [Thermoanaerobacterium aotearoense SCUT27]|uniref:Uncharacterized protein n=2 Tax=Thermoanaerobacterium TaxID=28895 RepID=W9EEK3_9THEO|nr:hypothetical protein Tsac_0417 [Thermoanaerobacterium saccharolyticum JW/SL-YS485]ETO39405.1 hypothetical protein V518_0445 [Thermoanaerobacterium aotearoense SCUT27]
MYLISTIFLIINVGALVFIIYLLYKILMYVSKK